MILLLTKLRAHLKIVHKYKGLIQMSWNGQMKERSIIFVFSNKGGANIALIISSHYVGVPGVIIGCYYVIMGTALPDLCLVREATGRGGSEENFLCLK